MSNLCHYLLIDQIKIENANAISSPITYGFPAINGFVGAIHALSRKLSESMGDLALDGVLIASHKTDLQVHRQHRYADCTFNQTRNPILRTGKIGAIIEEGRIHLTISLIVEIRSSNHRALGREEDCKAFLSFVENELMKQRMAGGSVMGIEKVELYSTSDSSDLIYELLPAFVLVDASEDLEEITAELQKDNPEKTALDSLIETANIHFIPKSEDATEKREDWEVQSVKQDRGWLVPIPIGYQGIFAPFEAGELQNARSNQYPSQYVEPIYSLGKWVFPFHLRESFESAFWRYAHNIESSNAKDSINHLYRLTQEITDYN